MEEKPLVEVNVSDLRFTQPDIAPTFKRFPDLTISDAVKQIRERRLNPLEKFKRVTVYEDNEGVLWCENNRTLYVLRMAGVRKFKAKMTRQGFPSRRYGEEDKRKRKDPNFLPEIRGESEVASPLPLVYGREESGSLVYRRGDSGSSSSEVRFEEESVSVVPGLLAAAAGALFAGYASWKLYGSTQSDHKK